MQVIHALSNDLSSTSSDKPAQSENLSWEVGKDLFGSYHSGKSDLSQNAKSLVKQRIREKHGKK